MFDYIEYHKFIKYVRYLELDTKQIHKKENEKYGGMPHFCMCCGIHVGNRSFHADGCKCGRDECEELWKLAYESNNIDENLKGWKRLKEYTENPFQVLLCNYHIDKINLIKGK